MCHPLFWALGINRSKQNIDILLGANIQAGKKILISIINRNYIICEIDSNI